MTLSLLQQTPPADPNRDQRAASDPKDSVWVNASAGSGKTKVLTERVMRLLLSGVKPEKILCLTYTRAGAAEMANRITSTLGKWAACGDAELDADLDRLQNTPPPKGQRIEARRLLARVLSCPGGLRIRTIHSFCQEILSRFPIEAGIPPHFALIDAQEIEILSEEILDDLLREADRAPNSDIAKALRHLIQSQNENKFRDMLREIMSLRASFARTDAARMIAGTRQFLQLEPGDTVETIRAAILKRMPESDLQPIAAIWAKGSARYKSRGDFLIKFLAASASERLTLFESYLRCFLTQKNEPLSSSFVASKEVREKCPQIDEVCQKEALYLISSLERIEAAQIAEMTEHLWKFGCVFATRLAARKAARAAVDYDDLILLTENLLRRDGIAPWILYKLDRGIDHILVDEAQDTSRAQWNIVEALTEEFYAGAGAQTHKSRTLFVVGDEKQSIFSFQNADPEAFHALRDQFSRRFTGAAKSFKKIPLRTSFRSAPAILHAVDTIFASDLARQGVSEETVQHHAFDAGKAGRVEVWPLVGDDEKEEQQSNWTLPTRYEEDRDPQVELAQEIAGKIKTWIDRRTILPGFNRPITPGDIMILLRRRGRFADLMVKALKACKVAVTGVDRMHLIRQLPVMDLLALLRFVLLPEDDLNLATLLRSPLIGMDEETLMSLAINRKGTLWDALRDAPALSNLRDYLQNRLNEADFSTPFAFLSRLLTLPCPGNEISGRKALWARLGDECLDPIEELLNAAQQFVGNRAPSLQNFLRWLTQADAEIKRELDHGDHAQGGQVRIMTVHASKGLEAPIVFLPDTTAVPRPVDLPKFQWSDSGFPLFLARMPHFGAARRVWQAARARQMEEYRRLFYVALTRASHRLYIGGWKNTRNEGNDEASWYALATASLRAQHQEGLAIDDFGPIPDAVFADDPPLPPAATKKPEIEKAQQPLPAWLRKSAATMAAPAFHMSLPDTAAATPDSAFARGRIIHRLLQSLPDIALSKRKATIARFLALPQHNLDVAARAEIESEVLHLLEDEKCAVIFATTALAEAPVAGTIDGVPVFRQIDRLCLQGDEIWIVDFKTNRPPPTDPKDVPDSYRKQLAEYRLLLSGIYPDKKIRAFLLWTYAPRLMEITA